MRVAGLLLVLLASAAAAEEDRCARAMDKVYRASVLAPSPPNLTGEWTSTRCEVRPGPEFVLRKYRFLEGGQFELHQYYYADADCHVPAYSLVARGSLGLETPSWIVPGAHEAAYQLAYVTVMPYSAHMAALLGAKLNRSCPDAAAEPWKAYERHEVLNYLEFDPSPHDGVTDEDELVVLDMDCTAALHLSFHELQLVRLEVRRRHGGHGGGGLSRTLYLGDLHTDLGQRFSHRPTGYQQPLALRRGATQASSGCPVCRAIIAADDYSPPRLHRPTPASRLPHRLLPGEWFSSGCEVRTLGTFLSRHLIFNGRNSSWEGYYHFFADEECREPMFSLYARGRYDVMKESPLIRNAFHVDIKISKVKVTPRDERILRLVELGSRDGKCAEVGSQWELGKERDVTNSGGCAPLNVRVPHVEYELIKLDKYHHETLLFLGQRPTDGIGNTPTDRPTSFQPPLVKCSHQTEFTLQSRDDKVGYTVVTRDHRGGAAFVTWSYLTLLVGLLLSLHMR